LSEEERRLVEEYLAEHPEARRQLEEMQETVSAMPEAVARMEPPRRVKEALMARIAAEERPRVSAPVPGEPSRRGLSSGDWFRRLSLAAAALAIAGVVILSLQVSQLRREIASLNQALVAQSNSLNALIEQLPQGTPSNVITVSLKGTDVQPQAQGQLIADPGSQSAVLVIAGLPPLEAGHTYQVWLIDGGAPVSAGLLTVDEKGQGVLVVTSEETIGSFNSLGISVEPEGGSLEPTGDIVVLSDI
jgi:anti-sigma-K factor RskA